jgi:hypothetical protein
MLTRVNCGCIIPFSDTSFQVVSSTSREATSTCTNGILENHFGPVIQKLVGNSIAKFLGNIFHIIYFAVKPKARNVTRYCRV